MKIQIYRIMGCYIGMIKANIAGNIQCYCSSTKTSKTEVINHLFSLIEYHDKTNPSKMPFPAIQMASF